MVRKQFWNRVGIAALLGGAAWCGPAAQAAFVSPNSWDRGTGGATYQEWDVFTDDNGTSPGIVDNTPDIAGYTNPSGAPSVTETTGNAFLTGGGNIYSFSAATAFTVVVPEADVPTPAHNVTAVVQIRTLGTELDYSSITMNGLAAASSVELNRVALGGFGGAEVDTWLLFNIPYASFGDGSAGVSNLTLSFNASGSSMSLDRLSIDTAIRPFGYYAEATPTIPEPASLALLAVGGAMIALRRNRA